MADFTKVFTQTVLNGVAVANEKLVAEGKLPLTDRQIQTGLLRFLHAELSNKALGIQC
jgi:hypothetical protein